MLDVARVFFDFDAPAPPEDALEELARHLFQRFDAETDERLRLPDYALYLAVEEGSVKGGGRAMATAAVVVALLGNYGDVRSGLAYAASDARAIGAAVVRAAERHNVLRGHTLRYARKSPGAVGKLQRIFERVESGGLTSEQAATEAVTLLDDGSLTAGDLDKLYQQFVQMEPLQGVIPLDDERRPPEAPSPRPPREYPAPSRFIVEIMREAKGAEPRVSRRPRKRP